MAFSLLVCTAASTFPTVADSGVLHLFTSNIRPLYEQDALNVLAGHRGQRFRFRYAERLVQPAIRDRWQANELKKISVRVHFSVQQIAHYHDAAYLPLRRGSVVSSGREGSLYVVEFEVREYAALPLAEGNALGERVRAFSSHLRNVLEGYPETGRSAVLGPDVVDQLDTVSEEAVAWEHSVGYLSKTHSFRDALFYRLSSVTTADRSRRLTLDDGRFRLWSGSNYWVTIAHFQTRDVAMVSTLNVAVDSESVEVVGEAKIRIASRYDAVPVHIHAKERDDRRRSHLSIFPEDPQQIAPRLGIELEVGPTKSNIATTVGGSAAAAAAVAAPGIFTNWTSTQRFGVGAAGASLFALLAWARKKR